MKAAALEAGAADEERKLKDLDLSTALKLRFIDADIKLIRDQMAKQSKGIRLTLEEAESELRQLEETRANLLRIAATFGPSPAGKVSQAKQIHASLIGGEDLVNVASVVAVNSST